MTIREWALVAFTLLIQTSVGVLLAVTVLHWFAARNPIQTSTRPLDVTVLVAAAGSVLALLASLAHLGNPQQAWLAVANARTSWLSREIVLAGAYAACTVAVAVLLRTRSMPAAMQGATCMLATGLGLATIYAMSRLYMVPAQPAWNRIMTPASFLATTIVLGAAVVIVLAASTPGPASNAATVTPAAIRTLIIVAIIVLAVQVLLVPGQVSAIVREPAAAISAASVGHSAAWLAAGRTIAAVGAIILLAGMLWSGIAPSTALAFNRSALVLIVLSEIFGRLLFYASSTHLGPV